MRLNSTFYFEDLEPGQADFETVNGRLIRLDPHAGYQANFAYELTKLEADEEFLPVDAIEIRLWLPDEEGRIWTACARTTAEFCVRELAYANFDNQSGLSLFDNAPEEYRTPFESNLMLDGVRFATDDRFYRTLILAGEQVEFVFKYSLLVFDVAVKEPDDFRPNYLIRLRAGDLYEEGLALAEIKHSNELPSLIFQLSDLVSNLLRAPSAIKVRGSWEPCLVPPPLRFEPTDEMAEPQQAVRVLNRE